MLGLAPAGYNSILIDFDALIDYKVGAINVLKQFYGHSKLINHEFINSIDKQSLIPYHISEGDPFKECLMEDAQDSSDIILDEIRTDKRFLHTVFQESPATSVAVLVRNYLALGDISVKIIAFNKLAKNKDFEASVCIYKDACEEFLLKNHINTALVKFAIKETRGRIDIRNYGRIMTDTSKHALEFGDPSAKSFVVLDYRENFTVIDNKMALNPELVLMFGDVNKLGYCNAYNNLVLPEG